MSSENSEVNEGARAPGVEGRGQLPESINKRKTRTYKEGEGEGGKKSKKRNTGKE